MHDDQKVASFPGKKGARDGGEFFAIDKRAFGVACELGLNPAVAYLTIARGSGHDNASSFWSVDAIERHTGISRPKAKAAVQFLIDHGLLTRERGGTRPRYRIVPGHEVPPLLSSPGERLLKTAGTTELTIVTKSAEPEWVWLPNALVDGAADENPPLILLRQKQDVRILRLFVAMYDNHELINDGGISRNVLWQTHEVKKNGERGAATIWAFDPEGQTNVKDGPPLYTIYVDPRLPEGDAKEALTKEFWNALYGLEALKLVEFVPHLFESAQPEGELIHSYAVTGGEPWERNLSSVAHLAGLSSLSAGQQQWAAEQGRKLVPVRSHIDKLAVIGIARLKYRPQTKMTAAWFAKSKEQAEIFTSIYQEIARDAVASPKKTAR